MPPHAAECLKVRARDSNLVNEKWAGTYVEAIAERDPEARRDEEREGN